jgi:glutaredoxin 3
MDRTASTAPKITVYTTEPCQRCIRAKNLLASRDLEFEEVNLVKDPEGRRRLADFTGNLTFPQIVIDGEPLGGLDDLIEADGNGALKGPAA